MPGLYQTAIHIGQLGYHPGCIQILARLESTTCDCHMTYDLSYSRHHHKSQYKELYVLTQFNIICNKMVIHIVVGHKINHVEGHEWIKRICHSF